MKIIRLYIILFFVMLTYGCRKELCYNHPHEGSITIDVDWRELPSNHNKPKGVKVVYISHPDQEFSQSFNFPSEGGSRNLSQNSYKILLTNNDSELVLFRGLTKWETSEAFTGSRRQVPYKSPPANVPGGTKSDPRYGISEADLLMVSNEATVEVTNDVEKHFITVVPKIKVITVTLRIAASGIKNVAEARGFLTGVSPSIFLGTDALSQNDATLLFDYGSAMAGTEFRSEVLIFGFVDTPKDYYKLGLELLLIDQKTVYYYEFDVTSKITAALRKNGGDLRLDEIIVIPDVEPPAPGGGGFNPGIGDWDNEDVEIVI